MRAGVRDVLADVKPIFYVKIPAIWQPIILEGLEPFECSADKSIHNFSLFNQELDYIMII